MSDLTYNVDKKILIEKEKRDKTIIKTSIIGILLNILLVIAKAIFGLIASSIAIILDAVNNLSDALSSIITIIGTKLSNKKPTRKHPYGFGRIEYLTSMIIAIIILFAGFTSIKESITSLIDKDKATYTAITIIVISIGIVVKIILGIYFRIMGNKTNSDNLKASGIDALFDAILSLATLIAAIIMINTGVAIEGYLGIIIGLFILKSGFEVLKEGFGKIIGERAPKEITSAIKKIIMSHPEIKGCYDMIIHDYGNNTNIASVHCEVDDHLTSRDIHLLSKRIEKEVYNENGTILTIGIYASNNNDDCQKIKKDLINIIKDINGVKQYHGFYLDEDIKLISFDLVINIEIKDPYPIILNVKEKMKEIYNDYEIFIALDRDYSD